MPSIRDGGLPSRATSPFLSIAAKNPARRPVQGKASSIGERTRPDRGGAGGAACRVRPDKVRLQFPARRPASSRTSAWPWAQQDRAGGVLETHVCVLQTALDLLAAGFLASTSPARCRLESLCPRTMNTPLRRMEQAGVHFDDRRDRAPLNGLGTAGTPVFKEISRLVQAAYARNEIMKAR